MSCLVSGKVELDCLDQILAMGVVAQRGFWRLFYLCCNPVWFLTALPKTSGDLLLHPMSCFGISGSGEMPSS